ncbi:glycoside hydrolase family 114 protein [Auricularia subglabra TFB-10046 SS5]|nr:glycoside hydrolase family 114 protein [Auricularia subglabra TFB-10046 SS5]
MAVVSHLFLCALSYAATAGAITNLPPNAKADYQLGGAYPPAADVRVVTRDRTESPAPGLYNICYINGFQTQDDEESFWKAPDRDALLLRRKNGQYFEDPDWPGEFFLDTSTDAKRSAIANIINGWTSDCASKGFNAVEFDNLDTYTRSNNLLTKDDNLALATLYVSHAHSVGLAAAQKNTAELEGEGKAVAGFDFAVAEECQVYEECDSYTDTYGAEMIEIEYTDNDNAQRVFQQACNQRGDSISILLRDRDLVPSGSKGYSYSEC